jgi:hypothetical protein
VLGCGDRRRGRYSQLGHLPAQLIRVLKLEDVHPHLPCAFQIQ